MSTPRRHALLAASGAVSLVAITIAIRVAGFPRTLAMVRWAARHPRPAPDDEGQIIDAVANGVTSAAIFCPARAECLEQALAMYLVLRRAGVPAELRFGAIRKPFSAHAWVELHGQPVREDPEQLRRYAIFSEAT
jgi:Transglutaminase-like superfamily